jgi:immune inhibitor A
MTPRQCFDRGMRRFAVLVCCLVSAEAFATQLPPNERKKEAPSKKDVTKVKVRRIEQIQPTSSTAPPPRNAVIGEHNIAVVLIETDDAQFKERDPKGAVEKLFFGQEEGALAHYYEEQSYGQYKLRGKVFGPIRVKGKLASYSYGPGMDGQTVRKLITQVFDEAKDKIDMKQFDQFNQFSEKKPDGALDHFAIIFPATQAPTEGYFKPIWPHRGTIDYGTNGKKLKSYYIFSYPTPLGTLAHEHGHDIGLPDLYDRDDSSHGVGPWCLMAAGSWLGRGFLPGHIGAYGKVAMGWVRPKIMARSQARVEIPAVETTQTVIKIPIGEADSQEYFLVENRQRIGYDQKLPDEGLLVWHIDQTIKHNDDETHKLVDVVESAAVQDLDQAFKDADPDLLDTFRAGKKARFAEDSQPNSLDYAGHKTGITIDDISASKSVMTASFSVPTVTVPEGEPFTIVKDNYTYGQFGAVPLAVGSEDLVQLTATEGAFDAQEVEMLIMGRPRTKPKLTVTIYEDAAGAPGRIRSSFTGDAQLKDDSYAWAKLRFPSPVRLSGSTKYWVGITPQEDQVAVAFNPNSVSNEARFRSKGDKTLKAAYNFAKGKEPVADFIVRLKGYGFIGVNNPKVPEQAEESDELIKRMREADAQLDNKQFLEAAATYSTVLQRMSEDPRRYLTWIPVVVNALGVADYQAKNYKGAIDQFSRSLRYVQSLGDPRAEADLLENLGETYFHANDLVQAEAFVERAWKMNADVPDRLLESEYWLGRIRLKKKKALALQHFDAAAALVKTVHKEVAMQDKWKQRLIRARTGTAIGEDAIEETRALAELKQERKAEAAADTPIDQSGVRKVDMSDFGFGP